MKLRSFFLMFTALLLYVGTGIRGATPDLKKSLKTEMLIKPKEVKPISEIVANKTPAMEFAITKTPYVLDETFIIVSESEKAIPTKAIRKLAINAKKVKILNAKINYRRARDRL